MSYCRECGDLPPVPRLSGWRAGLIALIAPGFLHAVAKATQHAVHLLEQNPCPRHPKEKT